MLGWVVFWLGLGVLGLARYFNHNCVQVFSQYQEQLADYKNEFAQQEERGQELIFEFKRKYTDDYKQSDLFPEISVEEFLTLKDAEREYLKQNGIPESIIDDSKRIMRRASPETQFSEEYPAITKQKNSCITSLGVGGVGLLLSLPVLAFYLLFLYLFPKVKEAEVK